MTAQSAQKPFRWKKLKQLAEGYGNRFGLYCNSCNAKVYVADFGNRAGLCYFYMGATESANEHLKSHRK